MLEEKHARSVSHRNIFRKAKPPAVWSGLAGATRARLGRMTRQGRGKDDDRASKRDWAAAERRKAKAPRQARPWKYTAHRSARVGDKHSGGAELSSRNRITRQTEPSNEHRRPGPIDDDDRRTTRPIYLARGACRAGTQGGARRAPCRVGFAAAVRRYAQATKTLDRQLVSYWVKPTASQPPVSQWFRWCIDPGRAKDSCECVDCRRVTWRHEDDQFMVCCRPRRSTDKPVCHASPCHPDRALRR